ncbi:MAG TPA: GNAT family N-acetyltransferase [Actinophytocola sp.]|uniref:GNAT family N-acetyltransferase n=1 Tax=Actinophytocola sp. TaxID=1872138 RepID=UPI002DDD759F|nr:GNAT family N-acetyltransferase [Actinophytocola sp.]HEV2780455.1 GNAT family N-acetyltransferase [Actinophytocola sp.]
MLAFQPVQIRLLPAAASSDLGLMADLTDLINKVYAESEHGLWVDGAARTSVEELAELTEAGQLAVARMDGLLAGCVRIQRLDDGAGEFGMLAADPRHRGIGIGRGLIDFAERTCRAAGADEMQLELLVPRNWTHPHKEFLATWYTRIGYRPTRTRSIEEAYPALAPLLATPCDIVVYRKSLVA